VPKHKYIETPDKLLDLFEDYVEKTKSTPRIIEKATNKGIQQEKHYPPLTMAGFEVYCFEQGSDCHNYFDNHGERYNEYKTICSHIKKVIRRDQIEGGMVGQYNPSITQRLNSLTEKQDITSDGDSISNITVRYVDGDNSDQST
jgi:hypothetical protein